MAIHAALCSLLLVVGQVAPPSQARTRPSCESLGHPLFGSVVCAPGDADGDGTPDLIVADPCYEQDHGTARAWLVSSRTMSVLFTSAIEGCSGNAQLTLRTAEGADTKGARRWSFSCSDAGAGAPQPPGPARLDLGDLDGDGTRDYAIRDQARVALLSGKQNKLIRMIEPSPEEGWSDFGAGLAAMGDVDGDKLCDLAVGAPDWGVAEGRVQVFSSGTGKCLYTVELDGEEWHSGRQLAAPGDLDGDGISELAVATWHALSHAPGRARIVSGKDGRTLVTLLRKGDGLTIEKRPSATSPK